MRFRIVAVVVSMVVASMACMQEIPQPAPTVVVAPPDDSATTATNTPAPVVAEPSKTPAPAPDPKYTVVASRLYIRNKTMEVVSSLDYGDVVVCYLLPSGWCLIDRDLMVWSGCLEPNTEGRECKSR